ncbi:YhfC family glutamic-type intramembrane protease [Thermaerobacter composti]|uniref:YhfC family glutamic-type intramembrane protease n=1 Tax=Thermaerobacter composti TaxID=554949 RepID=A0ABZ0QLI2_9FIRM|nr:YhfC family glutamic-type intramembrane protease [Thermaerobacter composti]WPD18276.1 YhfC family glutamic-type intramembrane protease [Thermaerobacter composti]
MDDRLRAIALMYGLAGAGAILLPAVVFWLGHRRWGWRARVALIGAATFLVFQGLLRLPWLPAFNAWATARWGVAATALLASLTAALWEETGRYVAYRLVVRRPRAADAVAMGLGHGGFESAVLVGLSLLATAIALWLLPWAEGMGGPAGGDRPGAPFGLPPEAAAGLRQAREAVLAGGFAAPALAFVERVAALALHVGLSVLVAAAWVRGRAILWAAAVGVHFAVNAGAVTLAQSGHGLLAEGVALVLAAGFLWRALRWAPVLDAAVVGVEGASVGVAGAHGRAGGG